MPCTLRPLRDYKIQDPTEMAAFVIEWKSLAWHLLMDEMCELSIWLAKITENDANGLRVLEYPLLVHVWVSE